MNKRNMMTLLLGLAVIYSNNTFAGDTGKTANTATNLSLKDQGVPKIEITMTNAPAGLSATAINDAVRNAFMNRGASEKMLAKSMNGTLIFAKSGDEVTFRVTESEVGAFEGTYKLITTNKTDNAQALLDGGSQKMLDEYATRIATRRNGTNSTPRNGAGSTSPKQR